MRRSSSLRQRANSARYRSRVRCLFDGTLEDGSEVQGRAGNAEIEALPDGRLRLAVGPLQTTGWVTARLADPVTGWRQFDAWSVAGEGTRTSWEWLEGQGRACGEDLSRGEDPRGAEATRMRLVFDAGQARTVRASEEVRLYTGEQWAEGGELEYSMRSRSFTLVPASGKRVLLGGPGFNRVVRPSAGQRRRDYRGPGAGDWCVEAAPA